MGVIGLRGLGHVAVKFARAFGVAKVTVISTSPGKREEALERLGADAAEMKATTGTMHSIVNTASAAASLHPYLALLKPQGKMFLLGIPDKPLQVSAFALIGDSSMDSGASDGCFITALAISGEIIFISWLSKVFVVVNFIMLESSGGASKKKLGGPS